jgi:predicted dehydrogenase
VSLQLVQVGLGLHGQDWGREAIPAVPEVTLAARVDPDAVMLAQAQAGLAAGPLHLGSLQEALRQVPCDAVLVTTSLPGHGPVVRAALEAGKHVLCEKPFVRTPEEAAALAALARRQGLLLMVSHNYRHFPEPLLAAGLVASGRYGALRSIAVDFRRCALYGTGHRHFDLADPLLMDMSIHHFDLLRMITQDEPLELSARTWRTLSSSFKGDAAGYVTMLMRSGVVVSYRGSWISHMPMTSWTGIWSMGFDDAEVTWSGRHDTWSVRPEHNVVVSRKAGAPEPLPAPPLETLDAAGALSAFARAVETGERPGWLSTGEDNIGTLALTLAAIRSAGEAGRPVRPELPSIDAA